MSREQLVTLFKLLVRYRCHAQKTEDERWYSGSSGGGIDDMLSALRQDIRRKYDHAR